MLSSTVKNMFTFHGRLNRLGFLLSFGCLLAVAFGIDSVGKRYFVGPEVEAVNYLIAKSIIGIALLAIWTPFIVRRLHDIGLSGWWAVLIWVANPLEVRNVLFIQLLFDIQIDIFSVPMLVLEGLLLMFVLGLFFYPGGNGVNRWGSPNQSPQPTQ